MDGGEERDDIIGVESDRVKGRHRQQPPPARFNNQDMQGLGGYDAIDRLTMAQCAKMPVDMYKSERMDARMQNGSVRYKVGTRTEKKLITRAAAALY